MTGPTQDLFDERILLWVRSQGHATIRVTAVYDDGDEVTIDAIIKDPLQAEFFGKLLQVGMRAHGLGGAVQVGVNNHVRGKAVGHPDGAVTPMVTPRDRSQPRKSWIRRWWESLTKQEDK